MGSKGLLRAVLATRQSVLGPIQTKLLKWILKNIMQAVIPEDLLKFGLIPEFIGRLPILTALDKLDESDLVRILTEPKNALVKQYKKLIELDGAELEFALVPWKKWRSWQSPVIRVLVDCVQSLKALCETLCLTCQAEMMFQRSSLRQKR